MTDANSILMSDGADRLRSVLDAKPVEVERPAASSSRRRIQFARTSTNVIMTTFYPPLNEVKNAALEATNPTEAAVANNKLVTQARTLRAVISRSPSVTGGRSSTMRRRL